MTLDYRCSTQRLTSKQWILRGLGLVLGLMVLGGCRTSPPAAPVVVAQDAAGASAKPEEGP